MKKKAIYRHGAKLICEIPVPVNSRPVSMRVIDDNNIAVIYEMPDKDLKLFVVNTIKNKCVEITYDAI